jgi:hypothetical protein
MNLRRSWLSTVVAACLVVLSTSPFTAPFSTCDVRDLTHHPVNPSQVPVADDGSLLKSKGLDLSVPGGTCAIPASPALSPPEHSGGCIADLTGVHRARHRELRL